jgi:hypothetical protein
MNFKLYLPSFLVLFILFGSCVDQAEDMSAPEISLMNSEPPLQSAEVCGEVDERVFILREARSLEFTLQVEDDQEVAEIKWDIHHNFDWHGHAGGSAPGFTPPQVAQSTEDWSFLKVEEVNTQIYSEEVRLNPPNNVTAGNYHFAIQAVDAVGNTSPNSDVYTIKVFNSRDSLSPTLELAEPQSKKLSANRGERITFEGQLIDDQDLGNGGNAIVFLTYRKKNSSNSFTGPFDLVPAGHGMNYNFNISFEVPNTLSTGDYIVTIQGHDGVRNTASFVTFDLTVEN